MFSRGWSRSFVSLFIALSIMFGTMLLWSEPASAATMTLTPAETRSLIGDTIHGKYYDGFDYVDFSFLYGGAGTITSYENLGGYTPAVPAGSSIIYYTATISPNRDPSYIQVDLQPLYSFFDTQSVLQTCGLSFGNYVSPSVYSSPSWRWHTSFDGDSIFENTASSGTYRANSIVNAGGSRYCTFVDAVITAQSDFSAYSYRACFYGNNASSGTMYFYVSCPTVSDDSTMASGTFGTTSSGGSGGDVNVTVDVNMDETNGLLGSLIDAVEGIVDAIAGLFVPSEEALEDFKDDMQGLLSEHLGGLYEAQDALLDYADSIVDADTTATNTITFPAVSVPVGGNNVFTFGGYNVDVKPFANDFDVIYDALALLVDVIATTAFVQMCRRKLEVFLHPEGEVIVS